jgi:uncharacterized protein YndB with AHSA1/START domain
MVILAATHGTYATVDDRPAVRFERTLAHPVEAVWRAVTDPAELAHWFPAALTVDLRVGGRMTFTFPEGDGPAQEGEVVDLDPPRRFAFSWDRDDLRFDLEPLDGGAGCLLRFTHVLARRDQAAMVAAGWHVCLDVLERRLAGDDTAAPGPEPTDEWRKRYDEYARRGVPTGAAPPG